MSMSNIDLYLFLHSEVISRKWKCRLKVLFCTILGLDTGSRSTTNLLYLCIANALIEIREILHQEINPPRYIRPSMCPQAEIEVEEMLNENINHCVNLIKISLEFASIFLTNHSYVILAIHVQGMVTDIHKCMQKLWCYKSCLMLVLIHIQQCNLPIQDLCKLDRFLLWFLNWYLTLGRTSVTPVSPPKSPLLASSFVACK